MSERSTLTCPQCGLISPGSAAICDCGFNFAQPGNTPPPRAPAQADRSGSPKAQDKPCELAAALFRNINSALHDNFFEKGAARREYRERYGVDPSDEPPPLLAAWQRKQAKSHAEAEDAALTALEERIQRELIDGFIEQHFQRATWEESRYIRDTVKKQYEAGDEYRDRSHCLQTFLQDGLDGVRKCRKKDKVYRILKLSLGIVWQLIVSVITVGLVLGVYSVVESRFEAIAASILVSIYATVTLGASQSMVRYTAQNYQAALMLMEVRTLFGKATSFCEKEAANKPANDFQHQLGRVYIYQFTLAIISLIALWKLVRAIGWI